MNKYIAILSIVFLMAACKDKPDEKTEAITTQDANGIATSTFKVWGNCEMCKETIENSLEVEGIMKADWDVDSKMITVNYDTKKISLDNIKKNISLAGYDNEKYKGDDTAYGQLPGCCQYERK